MRQPVVLKGPGATSEEFAAAHGVTPERQAAIREILERLGLKDYKKTTAKNRRTAKGNGKTTSRN
jgi:hypothetical protein